MSQARTARAHTHRCVCCRARWSWPKLLSEMDGRNGSALLRAQWRVRTLPPSHRVFFSLCEKSLRRCAMRNLHDARHVDVPARRRPAWGARARAHRTMMCVHNLSLIKRDRRLLHARARARIQHPRPGLLLLPPYYYRCSSSSNNNQAIIIIARRSWTVRAPCGTHPTRPASPRSQTDHPHARAHAHARRSSTDKATLPAVGGA